MSEMDKLDAALTERGIEHQYNKTSPEMAEIVKLARSKIRIPENKEFWSQIIVYKDGEYLWDAICSYGTYGYEDGLLEVAGSIAKDDVEGFLTADDIINRL